MRDMQNALEATLNQTGDLLDQLEHLLDEEQSLRHKQQQKELLQLSKRKEGVMQRLNVAQVKRERLLSQLKLTNDQKGLREFIESYARQPESLRELWANTQDKLQLCRQKNAVNHPTIDINI